MTTQYHYRSKQLCVSWQKLLEFRENLSCHLFSINGYIGYDSTRKPNIMIFKYIIIAALSLSGCSKMKSEACSSLIEKATNVTSINLIRSWFLELKEAPKRMKSLPFARGTIGYKGIQSLGLDLSTFEIPDNIVTLGLYSDREINYQEFKPELINSVSIGFGFREFLFLKVNGSKTFGLGDIESFRQNITVVSDDTIVMCR
jgi:hypothetical protein